MSTDASFTLPGFVIAGTDGEPTGDDAVALAATLADASGGPLEVVSVYAAAPVGWAGIPASYDEMFREDADKRLNGARKALADRPDTTFTVVRGGSPSDGLHRLLEERDPAIVVVGSSRTSTFGRIVAGSVTEQVIHAAPDAVAVAPRGWSEGERRIGAVAVAHNRSEQSRHAIAAGAELARRHGATLKILHVIDQHTLRYVDMGGPAEGERFRQGARQDLSEVVGGIADIESIEFEVHEGDPVSVLRGLEGVDVLVLASRNHGPLRRVMLGSVSAKLVRDASTPLLIVPAG
ncbi:MAG: universal stress protein [Solirubrobacteraceae bacterium]|nr:universal stress protein [Solirubrobacteraceae bacterium]